VLTVVSADGGAAYSLPAADGDVREPAWGPITR
jgi:TolB protein